MLSNLSNNNAGNTTKSVVEKKKYEDIENRLDEMQEEIDATAADVSTNSQAISSLSDRVDAVEDNSTFPELNTDTINPATGDKVEITSDLDVNGKIEANSIETDELSVNGTNFTTVKDNAAQAKSIAETAENKADEAYELADALSDELADYKADNEQSITTGTLNADSVVTDSIASQTINTNDFETTNAEIDDLYVDRIHATGELALPTIGQSYYTITIPAGTTASFAGSYITENDEIEFFYFTVTDGDVIYRQAALEVIKDISFDRETGNTKVRLKSTGAITYISSSMNVADPTIEDGGSAYEDFSYVPQKLSGQIIRGYNDTTTETFIAGVLNAYAIVADEIHYERTVVDDLIVNAAIELPEDWNQSGNISRSSGTKGQYISIQTKDGVDKPTWTDPVNNPIGSLGYSDKLLDEATMAAYKGISETRQTRTINVVDESSLNQLLAYLWIKNGDYWQPYEKTRVTIGDNTLWIDPTESNQGIRFYDGMVIADGTWDDSPVEEANEPPVNIVIYDAPTELSYPITNLGDKTTVHGEITATCFKGNVLGNVTGNADTATNATCFNNCTYAEAKADILSGTAANATCFDGCTYSEAKADILSGTAANATCFDGKTYADAKADILTGCAAEADNSTCFNGCTYAEAKTDILSGTSNNSTCFNGRTYACAKADILSGTANNATCFSGCTYSEAKSDILSGNAASATNATCFAGYTYECAKADIRNYTPSYATCTLCPIIHATDDTTSTQHRLPFAKYYGSTNDETPLVYDDCLYYVTVSQRLHTKNLCVNCCAEIGSAEILCLKTYNTIDGKACEAYCSNCAMTVFTSGSDDTRKLIASTCGWSTPLQTNIDYCLDSNTLSNVNIDISGCSLKAKTACFTGNVDIDCNVNIGGNLSVTGTLTGTAKNATCFDGCTYAQAKTDILNGTAKNATCFNSKTYACAKADILTGTAAQAHCVDIDTLTTSSYPLVMESATCKLGKSGTCSITFAPSTGILSTKQVSTACIENSGTIQSCNFCATNDVNIDGNTYITGDLTVLGTTTTTHSEEIVTPSENILLRDTATTPIASGCYSGFTVKNYDGNNNDLEVGANSDGTLHVGVVGGTMEPVATRATEACMENDYVAHWDSTGTDLITKGASCTHDLCINGDATVTGTLTADLTGNADTATNATCFNNCTYAEAKADILSGCAAEANDSTCFHGCTYACAKADILSGKAKNATCFDGCTYAQAKTDILNGTANNATCFFGHTYACAKIDFMSGTAANATCFDGCTYACAKADILAGTAKNATCFNGCTYAQAKTDILSGCAASADNATCFNGCTYACAKADILSGNAASADNSTCFGGCTYECAKADILSGCTADSAKLGNKDASCYIDNSSTAQTKAGKLCIGAPAACTTTSAGGNGVINDTAGGVHLYANSSLPYIHFHYNRYCGDFSTRLANTKGRLAITVNDGDGCTAAENSNIFDFYSDGTFKGARCICGTNIYQNGNKVIDESSTAQTKAGALSIGAPAACTSTSAGGDGTFISRYGVIDLYRDSCPYVDFHYQKYCGDFSSRIVNMYATNSCNGILRMTINNGKGCTVSDITTNYDFYSDGTFTGASRICASTNIYSAGCPVVTTGNIATLAPGYNCTGTSNYVVTTMVCCAKAVCRNTTTAACLYHLALFGCNTSDASADTYVSNDCPITYCAGNGVLNVQKVCQCTDSYHAQLASPNNATKYITLKLSNANGYSEFTSTVDIDVFNNHVHLNVKVSSGVVSINEISRTVDYGIKQYLLGDYDNTNHTITLYFTFTNYREANIVSSSPIVEASVSSTAPTGTFVDIPYVTHFVRTSSTNAEYPLVFSTCCATPATGNLTLYNDSANNLMYNPSTNTLTACCVRGNARVIAGTPVACTSTQTGVAGVYLGSGGTMRLFAPTPFIDFRVNNACADYSHRLIANNSYLRITATNATGCTDATQSANFDFCSNGTFSGVTTGVMNTICTACVNGFNAATNNYANLRFQATCCDSTTRCNWNMCLCGCNGKLYNPQGFMVGSCPVALLCDVPTLPPQPTQEDHYTVVCYECGATNVVTLSWDNSVCKTSEIFNLIMNCGRVRCMLECMAEWNRVCTSSIPYYDTQDFSITGVMSIPKGSCAVPACMACNFGSIVSAGVYAGKTCSLSHLVVRHGTVASDYFHMYSSDSSNECCGTVWMLGGGTVTITTPKITV